MMERVCCTAYVAVWPIASFRDNAALRSFSEQSGHQLIGKTRGIGRE
jgi:hypothetical protein